MSAVPGYFMDEKPENGAEADEQSQSVFWHWFALAVLLFCWVAEASMCADRGF